jgi:hypothetical protein
MPAVPEPAPPVRPKGGREPRTPAVLEVTGIVLGPSGTPEEGAEVVISLPSHEDPTKGSPVAPPPEEKVDAELLRELFALTTDEAASVSWYTGVPVPPAAPASSREAGRVRTGADGSFAIPVKARGPFRVEASKEGVGEAVADGARADGATVTLRLGAAQTLRGRVVQEAGNGPVAGAAVVVRAGRVTRSATTDADGAFAVPGLAPGKYHLTAGAPGFAPAVLAGVEAPTAEPVEVRLGAGRAAVVTVAKWDPSTMRGRRPGTPPEGDRTPLEGALVVLFQRNSGSFRAGVTGPDGTVRVDRLGPGTWEIASRKEGFGVGIGRALKIGASTPPEEAREVRLLPLAPTPLVVRLEDGSTLRNAAVYSGGEDEEFDPRRSRLLGRTDDQGRITVAFDDAVPWKAVAWVVPEEGGAAVRVEADEPGEEQKVVVPRGRVVQGVVKDQRGRVLGGTEVTLLVTDDENEVDLELRTACDGSGAFRFPAVPFGEVLLEAETKDGDFGDLEVEAGNRDSPLVREVVVEVFE